MEKYQPPYEITNEMLCLVSSIMEKIGQVNNLRGLSKFPILRKQNRIKSIYSSCAIEANSLSIDEVSDVINGVNVLGPKKDITEVQNALNAYELIETVDIAKETDLKRIHGVIGKSVVMEAGNYRTGNEGVSDENGNVVFIAPPPNMVPSLMADLFSFVEQNFMEINPLILSSIFHYEFVFIHPFMDGNGRMARYWQNAILGKWNPLFYWLPIESQIQKYQNEYYESISKSHIDGRSTIFITFMLKMINLTLTDLIKDTNSLIESNSIYVRKLLSKLRKNVWYTSNEILKILGLKSKETLRKNYINPAIKSGLLDIEFKDKPTSKNQRYRISN